jgi:23S rRNA pseudouridine955/2504/2580 synthase
MHQITVTDITTPMRLDRYLRTIDPGLSQGLIEKATRQGDIKLNNAKVKTSDRVSAGDIILTNDYFTINHGPRKQEYFDAAIVALADKITTIYKLYEDDNILVINKPSGLATQGGSNISLSIDHAIKYLNSKDYDLRLVHRLDRETSGVLVLAKSREAATIIGAALEQRVITKKYLAITHGSLKSEKGMISSYLSKIHDKIYEVSKNDKDAKLAQTEYQLLKSKNDIHLIEFTPHTGRMHQIRCHAAYSLKTPIVGDKKYGSMIDHSNLCLHAASILIPAQIFGKEIVARAPEPGYFKI